MEDNLSNELSSLKWDEKKVINYKGLPIIVQNKVYKLYAVPKVTFALKVLSFLIGLLVAIPLFSILLVLVGVIIDLFMSEGDDYSVSGSGIMFSYLESFGIVNLIILLVLSSFFSKIISKKLVLRKNKEVWEDFIRRYGGITYKIEEDEEDEEDEY